MRRELSAASKPVPDAGRVWQALTDMNPDTGLVPILLGFLDGGHKGRRFAIVVPGAFAASVL